jgi:hypothetical protein
VSLLGLKDSLTIIKLELARHAHNGSLYLMYLPRDDEIKCDDSNHQDKKMLLQESLKDRLLFAIPKKGKQAA